VNNIPLAVGLKVAVELGDGVRGFGWGMELSGFGGEQNTAVICERAGGAPPAARKRWCRMKNPPL
jgi:hypothetical protein